MNAPSKFEAPKAVAFDLPQAAREMRAMLGNVGAIQLMEALLDEVETDLDGMEASDGTSNDWWPAQHSLEWSALSDALDGYRKFFKETPLRPAGRMVIRGEVA